MRLSRKLTLFAAAVLVAGCPESPPTATPDLSRSEIAVDRPTGAIADGVDQVQIRVTVRDAAGNPVAGVQVQLAATGNGNTLDQPSAPTDDSGVTAGTLATTVAESKTISATLPQGALLSRASVVFAPVTHPPDGGTSDGGTSDAGTSDAGTPDAGGPEVTGIRILHYITGSGRIDRPADLSTAHIGAYVLSDAGTYAFFPGIGTNAGTFRIPSVPDGVRFLLQYNEQFIETSARVVDLSVYRAGRPDATRSQAGTFLHLRLNGMAPWTPELAGTTGYSSGSLHMATPSTWVYIYDLEQEAVDGGGPNPGDTEIDLIRPYNQ